MGVITNLQGTFELHNGVAMPYLGLGTYRTENGPEASNAVKWALWKGYRHIDTASFYRNEQGIGYGIAESGISRKEIFVTSKVWNDQQGYDTTLRAFDTSLDHLNFDYLDLYLIHWPVAGKFKETWRALEELYSAGKVRAIGVSNFMQHHLEDLLSVAQVVPMVNQVEFHPYLVQQGLLDFCKAGHIQLEAWSPLMQGKAMKVGRLRELAEKYGKEVAQIVLRWNLQKGVVTIPKSVRRDRIHDNTDIFDFELSGDDMAAIDQLDRGTRFGSDPDNFNF